MMHMVVNGKRKVGIRDISREANVAISTVSHVLNGTAPISLEVRERVLEAARRLGYLANRRAKASITTLNTVLLAVPSDTLPHSETNLFSWTLLSALMRECERRAIRIVPIEIDKPAISAARLIERAQSVSADGILLLNEDRKDFLQEISASGIPSVLINGEDQEMQIDSVTPGNRFAARQATNWLIRQGHRAIMHLTWEGRTTIRRRCDGFLDAFKDNGIDPAGAVIHRARGYHPEYGEEAIRHWIDARRGLGGVTAIFCAADNLALGVMSGLAKAGFSLPDDISIVGFDGIALGELTTPSLTTVRVPLEQMGEAALGLLEQHILSTRADRAAHRLELGCRLAVRDSVRRLD
jgi:LacI family transcriptional regulator, purine nucleotide synthesis repressor